jgi:hypothetical protein
MPAGDPCVLIRQVTVPFSVVDEMQAINQTLPNRIRGRLFGMIAAVTFPTDFGRDLLEADQFW